MEAQRRAAPPALFAPLPGASPGRLPRPGSPRAGAASPRFRLALTTANVALLLAGLLALALGLAWVGYIAIAPQRSGVFVADPYRMPQRGWAQDAERRAAAIINEPLPSIVAHVKGQAAPAGVPGETMPAAALPGKAAQAAMPAGHSVKAHGAADGRAIPPAAATDGAAAPGTSHGAAEASPLDGLVAMQVAVDTAPREGAELEACAQLRTREAAMCRVRVCSARWQHEAGCRTASAVESE